MQKIYYDGDSSKIIHERVILELIQDRIIEVRDNEIWYDEHFQGPKPILTLGSPWPHKWSKVMPDCHLWKDENGLFRIDYDYDKILIEIHEERDKEVTWNKGGFVHEGWDTHDNGTFK